MKETISQKDLIKILFALEERPGMYGTVREIQATSHTIYYLLCDDTEYKKFIKTQEVLLKKYMGKNAPGNTYICCLLKETDYKVMVAYLKDLRTEMGILNESVDNPKACDSIET